MPEQRYCQTVYNSGFSFAVCYLGVVHSRTDDSLLSYHPLVIYFKKLLFALFPFKTSLCLFLTSDDAELLWRLARSSRDLAQLGSTSAEEKKQLTYDSLEYAKKALEKNESNSAAHKVSHAK